jgi:hypothetical protein
MNVGLPGTGLGSLFYLCLVLYMPIRELYFMARGKSSAARWKMVGFQWIIFSLILLVMWLEAVLFTGAITWLKTTDTWLGRWLIELTSDEYRINAFGQFAAITSFIVLASVCLILFFVGRAAKAGWIKPSTAVPAYVVE